MNIKWIEIFFWIALFIVFYTYIGYGIVLYMLVKIKEAFKKPIPFELQENTLPTVSLFITAFNEEDVVDEKMHNSLSLDYPRNLLKIVWVTDGSNDQTNSILQANWGNDVTVLFDPRRQGKTAAINRGMPFIEDSIVVFRSEERRVGKEC